MNRKNILLYLIIIALVAAGVYFYATKKAGVSKQATASQMEAIKAKAEKFINENLVQPGTQAKIKDIVEENGLYKIIVNVNNQDIPAYISQDGKNFFPDVYKMDEAKSQPADQGASQPASKKDVPEVDLFVMSYCPYGLQAEKGILPVVNLLGSKIKFNLKFVDYAMHGEKEIDENLRQYCIGQIATAKLSSYLKCFAEQENSDACLKNEQISSTALSVCAAAADVQFQIKAKFNDKNTWPNSQYPPFDIHKADNEKYNVSGSPTLVINGTTISSARDPQSLLNAVCSGFTTQPSECQQKLSSDTPSAGFGATVGASAGSSASCATQ